MYIRNATEKDLPAILEIFNFEIIHTANAYIYDPWTLDYALEWFRDKKKEGFPFIVMEEKGEVIGYSYYGPFRTRPAYKTTVEYSVYIHRDHRRKGIAVQLVDALFKIARENGIHVIMGGVDAGNVKSIHFHEKLGFTQVAYIKSVAYKFDKWLDLILFQLILE